MSGKNMIMLDTKGILYEGRPEMNHYKNKMALIVNREKIKGGLKEAVAGAKAVRKIA